MAAPKALAVIGIGNTIAGDDGVGVHVVRNLEQALRGDERILVATLEGDLFAVADLLRDAERFIFVDALAGEKGGAVVIGSRGTRAYAPSFHQTDIGSVMESLEQLGIADPFPKWDIWGITILPPRELKPGLSPEVRKAANVLAERLELECRRQSCAAAQAGTAKKCAAKSLRGHLQAPQTTGYGG